MGGVVSLETKPLQGIETYTIKNEGDYKRGDLLIFSNQGLQAVRRTEKKIGNALPADGTLDISKIKESGIKKGNEIGSGKFGVVYEGTLHGRRVAIKECRPNGRITFEDFKKEADIMKDLKHKNVIGLIEVWTELNNFVIVMEFMENGDLLTYLRSKHIDQDQMKRFAIDIANGMQYLESRNIVHRDLAARNVLHDSSLTAKVADFGLARFLDPGQSTYASKSKVFPVMWTAPEGFDGNFSTKSDVWSYGIVLIEIVTRGGELYEGVWDLKALFKAGERHTQPKNCSDALYQLMLSCWNSEPSSRPNFSTITKKLADINFEK